MTVEVTTASGAPVDGTTTITPNGIQIYIPNAGDYIVNFTLPDGDEYYGEFTVTDWCTKPYEAMKEKNKFIV